MTPLRKIDRCRACQAPIVWAQTSSSGRAMPVDAEPSPDGTFALVHTTKGKWIAVHVGKPVQNEERHTSHFAKCPAAASFRKQKP